MHQRRQPARHLVRTPVTFFAHQHVDATVVIIRVIEGCDTIFLGPIGFEIGKGLIVETTDQRQGMGIVLAFAQVLAMLFETALLLPETRDPRAVLPAIESHKILVDIHCAQGNPRPQPGIETPINLALRLRWAQWVTLAAADDHLLWITARQRIAQPRLWQLPEQGAFATIAASRIGRNQQAAEQGFGRRFIELPDQTLAGRVASEQPITGSPESLAARKTEAFLHLQPQLGFAGQAQIYQRLAFEAEAQPVFGFIGY
ncbi:hypothetical protein D3C76_806310 [compost metagenome]